MTGTWRDLYPNADDAVEAFMANDDSGDSWANSMLARGLLEGEVVEQPPEIESG